MIETADGALAEVHSILQRMNELSIRASTGTLSDDDREKVQDEVTQLRDEIARIARDTQFNGETLLDGNFDLKGYTNMEDVKVGYYSDYVTTGTYGLTGLTVPLDEKGEIDGTGLIGTPVTGLGIGDAVGNGVVTAEMPADATITEVIGNKIKITSEENADFEINVKVYGDPNSTVAINNMQMDITGIGAMTMQIGANEGQTLDIRIPTISLEELNIKNIDMSTQVTAQESINNIKSAILYVSEVRSRLGAYQNRLDHCISNLDIGSENMTAAYSRIMVVDIGKNQSCCSHVFVLPYSDIIAPGSTVAPAAMVIFSPTTAISAPLARAAPTVAPAPMVTSESMMAYCTTASASMVQSPMSTQSSTCAPAMIFTPGPTTEFLTVP